VVLCFADKFSIRNHEIEAVFELNVWRGRETCINHNWFFCVLSMKPFLLSERKILHHLSLLEIHKFTYILVGFSSFYHI
jgi:hypothetical protein